MQRDVEVSMHVHMHMPRAREWVCAIPIVVNAAMAIEPGSANDHSDCFARTDVDDER